MYYKDQGNFILENLSQCKTQIITTINTCWLFIMCQALCYKYVSFIISFIPHNNPLMCVLIILVLQMKQLKHRV